MVWCELGDECFELVSTLYRRGADQAADSICSCLEIECLRLVYCSVRSGIRHISSPYARY